jgi:HKD family nuclease
MIRIATKLSDNLKHSFKFADEIWIAVALLNLQGIEFVEKILADECIINFIGGVDLPTDPAALKKILAFRPRHEVRAYVFTQEVYHPKVFIARTGYKLQSFVGSSNCTNGGFNSNVEMNTEINDQSLCKELVKWFSDVQMQSEILTSEFIAEYTPIYLNRVKRKKEERAEIDDFKTKERRKLEAQLKARKMLISKLKSIQKSKQYLLFKEERKKKIKELKASLDYPNFKKLDLASFWKIKDLGTIVPIRLKAIIDNDRTKFTRLMKYICNDRIPINIRMDEALKGNVSMTNIGIGFISKILVIHNPNKFYIHNKEFYEYLKPFGLSVPRNASFGNKYEATRNMLQTILDATNIDDFAVLDRCLISL